MITPWGVGTNMLIFWGSYSKTSHLGKVVDHCSRCRGPQPFEVTQHFEASHIYFLRITGWRLTSSIKQCMLCKREDACDAEDYVHFVPPAQDIAFELLLRKTNPKLAAMLRADAYDELFEDGANDVPAHPRDDVAIMPASDVPPAPDGDSDLQQLLFLLADYDANDPELFKLKEKLKFWRHLSASQKAELSRDARGYCDKQERVLQAKRFLVGINPTYPSRLTNIGCVVMLMLMGASFPVSYALPPLEWYWTAGYYVAWCVVMFFLFGFVVAMIEKYWIKNIVLPAAADLSIQDLLHALHRIETWTEEEKSSAGEVVRLKDTLIETLRKLSER
ncbi:MAG TPA: hypothetical protein VFE62_19035 [Gemmataceae bacterium]|nr:hypothetical protein [Gemmataceae bacterium]